MIVYDHGDLDSDPWSYYLLLQNIVDILRYKRLTLDMIDHLDVLITDHHCLYLKLFGSHLKPKFHHMLHYKHALLSFGPLSHLWGMRFEAKNHKLKLYTQVIRFRVNPF